MATIVMTTMTIVTCLHSNSGKFLKCRQRYPALIEWPWSYFKAKHVGESLECVASLV
jgi:hypothetical protein